MCFCLGDITAQPGATIHHLPDIVPFPVATCGEMIFKSIGHPVCWTGSAKATHSLPDVLGQEVCAHDKVRRKINKYALTVFDVASLFKATEPLATTEAKEVAKALSRIYRRGPLKWPKVLQVDLGHQFMGAVNQLLAKQGVSIRRGRVDIHRDQGIVERFNRTLAIVWAPVRSGDAAPFRSKVD